MKQIGVKLMQARIGRNWSIQDLSDASGLGHVTVEKIEIGFGRPTFESVVKQAQTLGVSIESLVGGDGVDHTDVQMMNMYSQLSEDQQRVIKIVIDAMLKEQGDQQ